MCKNAYLSAKGLMHSLQNAGFGVYLGDWLLYRLHGPEATLFAYDQMPPFVRHSSVCFFIEMMHVGIIKCISPVIRVLAHFNTSYQGNEFRLLWIAIKLMRIN